MKLVNTLYDLEFDLIENQILVLSIENHLVYWIINNCYIKLKMLQLR